MLESVAGPLGWLGFIAVVLVLLAVDLGVFQKRAHEPTFGEAIGWTVAWVLLAGVFAAGTWWAWGAERALEFSAAYVIEKALSVDNLFVVMVVMQAFAVPAQQRHRVLFWGVLGALVMRALFIVLGAALVARFHAVLYVFGLVLVATGVKLLARHDTQPDPAKNVLVRAVRRLLPVTDRYHGGAFFVREGGRRVVTPLLLALVAIEGADLVFAVDSIPAVFAVSRDPFIVFTSNVLAILGLRSLFFVVAGALERFHLLRFGLAGVLLFVGAKMLLVDVVHVPVAISLAVIASLIGAAMVASLLVRRVKVSARPTQPA